MFTTELLLNMKFNLQEGIAPDFLVVQRVVSLPYRQSKDLNPGNSTPERVFLPKKPEIRNEKCWV